MTPPRNPPLKFECLVHMTLGKPDSTKLREDIPFHDTSEYWRALQLAPNLNSLALFDFAPINTSLKPDLQRLFGNLKSLRIGASMHNEETFVDHFKSICRHCRVLEKVQIIIPQHSNQLARLLGPLQPFTPALKRLQLSLDPGPFATTHLLANFAIGFQPQSLSRPPYAVSARAHQNRAVFRFITDFTSYAIPARLQLGHGRSGRSHGPTVRRGSLPEFRILHVACDCQDPSPSFTHIEDVGVEVFKFRHHATLRGGDLAALDAEDWQVR
ncbi:hypothetical protein BDP81DRAFT_476580 [Colletotrichum phormii]|uniref:Uncharacterized protein n=1 Tax=Colletotrichum phormii TaxID=359342 RepID=A0AAJ0E846_9PEZI|nr:uncharacterized protein BDP81DRAFT_476580 [Colletotrichum phormii]KAK1622216.1 hypothetical protein BDP81DRAFT_476580 [Colletotrichum phormii]